MRFRRSTPVETPKDRLALARDAGIGSVSVASVFAGTLVAFGASILFLGVAAATATAFDLDANLAASRWREAGAVGGAVLAGALFLSYLFGGYSAGRMARRQGVLHGILVTFTSLVAVAVAVVVARLVTNLDGENLLRDLRSVGVPTTGSEWGDTFTVAGLAALAGMLVGSVLGGALGDRWHSRLLARALDPEVGTEGAVRRHAATAHDDAVTRVERSRVGGGVDLRDGEPERERGLADIEQDADA
jgi:hypothetical protein